MATDRKEKIEALKKITSGVDPRPPDTHILLNKLSTYELYALLDLKKLPKQDIEEILQGRNLYSTEEIKVFLSSEEFKTIMQSKPGDHFILFEDAAGCEPIINVHEQGIHISTFHDYSDKEDTTDAPQEETQPVELTTLPEVSVPLIEAETVIEHEPMIRPAMSELKEKPVKKPKRTQKTFNLLGEITNEMERDKARAKKMNSFAAGYKELNH